MVDAVLKGGHSFLYSEAHMVVVVRVLAPLFRCWVFSLSSDFLPLSLYAFPLVCVSPLSLCSARLSGQRQSKHLPPSSPFFFPDPHPCSQPHTHTYTHVWPPTGEEPGVHADPPQLPPRLYGIEGTYTHTHCFLSDVDLVGELLLFFPVHIAHVSSSIM